MKVSSSSSEMKSKYPEENVQNMKDMFRACESLYAELMSLKIEIIMLVKRSAFSCQALIMQDILQRHAK